MRQAGRYLPEYRALRERAGSFLDLCYTPELAAEATLQPIKRFGMDGAILFSDILVVPQALGQKLWFEPSGGPKLTAVRNAAMSRSLTLDQLDARLGAGLRGDPDDRRAIAAQTALIGFAGAPWTVATYMVEGGSSRDFAKILAWATRDDGSFDAMIDKLVEATTQHLAAEIAAGVEAVQLFDTWAGIVPENEFERLVIEPTRRIVERVHHAYPDAPVIGFPRGIGALYRPYFAETGIDALSLDAETTLRCKRASCKRSVPCKAISIRRCWWPAARRFEAAVERILDALGDGPFVFNLGHGVVPETPPEHVARLGELIRRAWLSSPSCCSISAGPIPPQRSSRSCSTCSPIRRSSPCPIRCAG